MVLVRDAEDRQRVLCYTHQGTHPHSGLDRPYVVRGRRPSDTNVLRLLQSNLLEQDVERGRLKSTRDQDVHGPILQAEC